MDKSRETATGMPEATVAAAWQQVGASFEYFYLTAGVSTLSRMMGQDADDLCGPRYGHKDSKAGHRVCTHSQPVRIRTMIEPSMRS